MVGKFKGMINIYCQKDREKMKFERSEKVKKIITLLNGLSMRKSGKLIHFNANEFATNPGKNKFKLQMDNLMISHLNI